MMHRLLWIGFGAVVSFVAAVAFAQNQNPTGNSSSQAEMRPRPRPVTRPVPLPANTRFVILYDESETPQEFVKEFQQYLKDLQNPSQTRPNQTQPSQGKPQDSAQSDRNGEEDWEKFREFIVKHRNSTPPNQPVVFSAKEVPSGGGCPALCITIRKKNITICICPIIDIGSILGKDKRVGSSQNPVPPNTVIFVMGEQLAKQMEQADAQWWREEVFARIPTVGRPEPVSLTIKPGSIPR